MNTSNNKRCLLKWGFCDGCNKDIFYGDIIYKEPIIAKVNINYFSYNYCEKCKKNVYYNEEAYASFKTVEDSFIFSKIHTLINEIENDTKLIEIINDKKKKFFDNCNENYKDNETTINEKTDNAMLISYVPKKSKYYKIFKKYKILI